MKKTIQFIKPILAIILFTLSLSLAAQTPTFDELEFEPDSTKAAYKPIGKNFVFLRSKRGNSGLTKTPTADAITSMEVTEIVLVYSELEASALAEREEGNRERWENLLMTYPEFFQFSTTYKNVCQCNFNADPEAFKKVQGFYIYINGTPPKAEEPVAEAPPAPAKPAETPAPSKPAKVEETPAPATKPLKTAEKEVAVQDKTVVKQKELPPPVQAAAPVETPAPTAAKTEDAPATEETKEEVPVKETRKTSAKPKAVVTKPRRAKNPRDCRQPCFGFGDEDLILYFKDNIPLTKKQRRKAKNWTANVRLQIHHDGTIKKAMVTGNDEVFTKQVEGLMQSMPEWKAAVKNGVAVKSEVRFTLKYDKESKSMKPADIIMNPKGSPKCPCVTDSEIFGSD